MSNKRRPARLGNHSDYLRSEAWKTRRRYWHAAERRRTGRVSSCAVCFATHSLELHHLEYTDMFELVDGEWVSKEQHADLVALCRRHHEAVHRKLDTDAGYRDNLTRREASIRIITAFRRQVLKFIKESAESHESEPADAHAEAFA